LNFSGRVEVLMGALPETGNNTRRRKMNRIGSIVLASSLLFTIGCKDAFVDDIEINIGVNDADVNGDGVLVTEKNISTEQGNPYGQFLSDLQAEFGDDPVFIDLVSASMVVVAGGTQANLEEIYTGVVTLSIVDDSSGVVADIATIDSPAGAAAVELDVNSDAFDDDAFQATLNDGSFKVRLSGTPTDPAANINTDISVILSFSADK
jgi:hypothetical protein